MFRPAGGIGHTADCIRAAYSLGFAP